MKFIPFFILTLIALLSIGGYGVYALFIQPAYPAGATQEYQIYPEEFRVNVNGETAVITNGQSLTTPTGNFVLPIIGKFKEAGEVRITVKTGEMGLTEYNILIATGDYADSSTSWTYSGGTFNWRSPGRPIFGGYHGLHIISGNPEMDHALESIKNGDTVTITGFEGDGKMTMIQNGETFTARTRGCERVIITGLKITRA